MPHIAKRMDSMGYWIYCQLTKVVRIYFSPTCVAETLIKYFWSIFYDCFYFIFIYLSIFHSPFAFRKKRCFCFMYFYVWFLRNATSIFYRYLQIHESLIMLYSVDVVVTSILLLTKAKISACLPQTNKHSIRKCFS